MDITVKRADLSAALTTAKRATDPRSTMNQLACARLTVRVGSLEVAATDLATAAVVVVASYSSPKGKAGKSDGVALVDAKRLAAAVDGFSAESLRITHDGKTLTVAAGKARQEIPTIDAAGYPKIADAPEDASWSPLDGTALSAILAACLPAACTDETRFHLTGVRLESQSGTIRGAATDGHRLHLAERTASLDLAAPMIVPGKACGSLLALLKGAEEAQAAVAGGLLHVRVGAARIVVKPIDAQYPPIAQVIPEHPRVATFDASELAAAVRRAGLAAGAMSGVLLTVLGDGVVTVEGTDGDGRRATDEVECVGAGPEMAIRVQPSYLLDAIAAVGSDRVALRLAGSLDPIEVLRAGDDAGKERGSLAVVMPLRI